MFPAKACSAEAGTQALHYVGMGYAVLPIAPGEKHPHPILAPNGFADATTNRFVITAWFRNYPDANLGVVVPDGVAVLDFDDRGALRAFLNRYRSLEHAPRSRTPRGAHVWVAVPQGIVLRTRPPASIPPFEVKKPGKGFVLEHPSRTASGVYEWELPLQPPRALPKLPSGLLNTLKVRGQAVLPAVSPEDWERILRRFEREATPGNRHNALTRAACLLKARNAPASYMQRLIEGAIARGLPVSEVYGVVRWVDKNVKAAGRGNGGFHQKGACHE